MYDIARAKKIRQGKCELCPSFSKHLEKHHITYEPERVRYICHKCHFTAHYYPERFTEVQKVLLLNKVMPIKDAYIFAREFKKDRVKLAKAFAPSRRKAIRDSQKEHKKLSANLND